MPFPWNVAVAISLLVLALAPGYAQTGDNGCDALVVDVNVPGSRAGETTSPDDVYIAPQEHLDIGAGSVFRVFRHSEVGDERLGRHALKHYIGRLQIIDVQEGILVGRMLEFASRQDHPRPRYESIMLGDCLELEPPPDAMMAADAKESLADRQAAEAARDSIASGILFRFDSSEIDKQWEGKLERLARFIEARMPEKVIVEGHADWTGTDEYNIGLSRRRAQAVVDYLVTRFGLDRGLFGIEAYGESRPVASNETAEGRRKNRRAVPTVLFRMVPPDEPSGE
jgi:outer membrane protein OmpA-like peptidoglycan-associated protein